MVMVFIVAVGVAKTINFSYTSTLSTCPIYMGITPWFLLLVSASQLNFCDAETRSKNRGSEAHINWTCDMGCGQAKYGL